MAEARKRPRGDFVHQQMLTYLGNKRLLVQHILDLVGDGPLRILDLFTGTGVVARGLASRASHIYANDLEEYATLNATCFLVTPSPEDQVLVREHIAAANRLAEQGPHVAGIITQHYAPADSNDIQAGERCFYTHENALRIDTVRAYVAEYVPERLQSYVLAPLLIKCSVHTNTSGQFQAFHKNRDGVGQWGGHHRRSLARITAPIVLECPAWGSAARGHVTTMDAMACLDTFADGALDVIYLDPPYNQRQYSSLYFLLNIVATNRMPEHITQGGVTQAADRNDSVYCRKVAVRGAFEALLEVSTRKAARVILSYNNEGLLSLAALDELLAAYRVTKHEFDHKRHNVRGDETAETPKKTREVMYVIQRA
jgi:adenine-specific DNA-methyltransferase